MSTRAPFHERLTARLFEPVDASSLVFFRVAFGVIMLVDWIPRDIDEDVRDQVRALAGT